MTLQQPGVLVFGGDIVCYEFNGSGLRARALGETGLLPVTAELEAAIRSDLRRQRVKQSIIREREAQPVMPGSLRRSL